MGVISRSALLKAGSVDRMDAEFYDGEAVSLENSLQVAGLQPLRTVAKISDVRLPDPRKRSVTDPKAEFDYLEISDVDPTDGFALSQTLLCSGASPRARTRLPKGAIVMSSVRPARNAVFLVDDDQAQAIGSTGFIVLQALGSYPPEAIFAALKTETSIQQLARRGRASMYPALYPPDVLDILVPILDKDRLQRVVKLVRDAERDRRKYMTALTATNVAASGFFGGAKPDQLLQDLSAAQPKVMKRSALLKSERFDAEFHAAAYSAAQSRLRALAPCRTLGQLASRGDTGRTPASHEYEDESGTSVGVIKVVSLTNRGINWSSISFAPGVKFAGHQDSSVANGDIVLTSSAHSAPHIARKVDVVRAIPAELQNRVTFAGEVMRIRLEPDALFSPEYVAAFLRSALGGEQIRRCTRGITSHIYTDDVLENVLIPQPDPGTAQAVQQNATAAHAARWGYRNSVIDAIRECEQQVSDDLAVIFNP